MSPSYYELMVNGANDGLISFFIKDGCFMDYSGNYNIRSNSISLYKGSNLLIDS